MWYLKLIQNDSFETWLFLYNFFFTNSQNVTTNGDYHNESIFQLTNKIFFDFPDGNG